MPLLKPLSLLGWQKLRYFFQEILGDITQSIGGNGSDKIGQEKAYGLYS
jgi:hypothetical protein